MRVELYIQGQKVKMFDKDETIKINRKVKDYRDIEKIFSDFSESFTLPGEANNALFKHYYDADVNGSFDARVKQPAQIYVDQELFKNGVIQLKNVQIKNNKVDSYKVQFFTELTQLIDTFGEDELSDLDFSAYNHAYNFENVFLGLTQGLFNENIIYPLISYDKRFLYNETITDSDKQVDIFQNGFLWTELKPAIKVNRIFDAIQIFYGLSFSGSIFNSVDLENMYISLNSNDSDLGLQQSIPIIETAEYDDLTILIRINVSMSLFSGSENTPFNVKIFIDDQLIAESGFVTADNNNQYSFQLDIAPPQNNLFEAKYIVEVNESIAYGFTFSAQEISAVGTFSTLFSLSGTQGINSEVNTSGQFQEFKVKDFVKAFVNAFNLVVIPLNETDILFEPLNEWYGNGNIIDITPYTDSQDLEIKPGELISGVNYKFDKNETLLSSVFKENNNRGFGNLNEEFFDANGEKLQGDLLEINLPFEKPVFEKIADNTQYGYFVNRQQEHFNPFHCIFYKKKLTGSQILLIDDDDIAVGVSSYFCPFTSQNPQSSLATNFEIELDEFTLNASSVTFYTKYWADYVNDLFSIKRRNYNLTARLPLEVLRNIELNDKLLIGQRRYVINSYQADLMTQEVKLDLFNDIFSQLDIETASGLEQSNFIVSSQSTEVEFKMLGQYDVALVDVSVYGWTSSFNGKLAKITTTENVDPLNRTAEITIRNINGDSFLGYITQLASNEGFALEDTEGNLLTDTEGNNLKTYGN